MEVYKFKSIASINDEALEHTLDIIRNDRLYCSTYDQMNDPFEGILGKRSDTEIELGRKNVDVATLCQITDEWKLIKQELSEQKFCSVTTAVDEVLMWSHYAGNAHGVAVKLEVPDAKLTRVRYVEELQDIPSNSVSPKEQLSYKLSNWSYEREFRLFHSETYYSLTAPVSEVIVSPLMAPDIFNCIKDACWKKEIDIIPARFDQKSGKIRT